MLDFFKWLIMLMIYLINQPQTQSLTTAPVMNNAFSMSGGQPTFQAFNQPMRAPVPTYSIPQPSSGNFSQFPSQMPQPTSSLLMSSDSGKL